MYTLTYISHHSATTEASRYMGAYACQHPHCDGRHVIARGDEHCRIYLASNGYFYSHIIPAALRWPTINKLVLTGVVVEVIAHKEGRPPSYTEFVMETYDGSNLTGSNPCEPMRVRAIVEGKQAGQAEDIAEGMALFVDGRLAFRDFTTVGIRVCEHVIAVRCLQVLSGPAKLARAEERK